MVRGDGRVTPVSPIQGRLLARLAAAGGQTVPLGVLIEAAWPGEAERLVSHSPYDEQRWVFFAQALEARRPVR